MIKHIRTNNGNYKYKFRPTFIGAKAIDKRIAKENLLFIKHFLDEQHITFLLSFGTLLGAVREHDFIAHDEDTDLIMMKEDMGKMLDLLFVLREKGFEVIRYESRGLLSIMRKGEYIDFYFYQDYPSNPQLSYCGRDLYFKKELVETSELQFLGETFKVPKDCIKYLKFNYGDNWHQPIARSNFNMSKTSMLKSYLLQHIKAFLPEILVEKIQWSRDRKHLDKWKEKIEKL